MMEETNSTTADPQLANVDNVKKDKEKFEKKVRREKDKLNRKRANLKDEYSRLTNRFERALIEHKLAVEYFEYRSFYFDFLPTTIIATLTTIIGFLISGSPQNIDGAEQSPQFEPLLTGQSKQKLSIFVGILGALTTLLNAIGKRTNYQSQCDMHKSAVKALEKICLTVDFEKDWFNRSALSENLMDTAKKIAKDPDHESEYENLAERLGADLKSHQASFKAMQDACSESPVPTRIIQAFTVLDQVAGTGDCTQTTLIFYYHKLWKEFSTYQHWPRMAPRVDVITKYREWKKASQFPSQGDTGPSKESVTGNDASNKGSTVAEHNASEESKEPLLKKPSSYGTLNV